MGPSIDFAGRPHRALLLDVNKDSFGSLTCGGIGERNSQRNASSSLQCQSLCVSPPHLKWVWKPENVNPARVANP